MGIETVLSILGPSRVRLDGGGGGALTPEMVAGALGSARDADGASLLLARARSIGYSSVLEERLYQRALQTAQHQGWRCPAPRRVEDLMRALMRLALLEFLDPLRCPVCKGRAKRYSRQLKADQDCSRCDGVGAIPLTDRERARELGIPQSTWDRTWADRYQTVMAWLSELYGTAEGDVRRALK